MALSFPPSLFLCLFPSVNDGCFFQIKWADLHSFGLYSASNNVTVAHVHNEVGRPVQEVPFCCVYYHTVLLIKQVSVLTRKIKMEVMNRSKGFPSVWAHLFILVVEFVLFFSLIGIFERAAACLWRSVLADAPSIQLLLYSLQWQANQPFLFKCVKVLNMRQFVIMENGSTLFILRAIKWFCTMC